MAPEQLDELLAELSSLATGIVEADDGVTVYFASRELALPWGEPVEVAAEDWSANWQEAWHSFSLGERWFLAPPWDDAPTPPGRVRLPMTPGNVFGSGDHPTTQMCLELLETAVSPGRGVIDIGTGTGILAVAAQALGARVFACDLDTQAVETAQGHGIPVWRGSTESCRSACADLVVANLPGGLLLNLLPELRRIAPCLLVSGYLDIQQQAIEQGAQVLAQGARGEWRAALLGYPEDRPA